MTPDAHYLVFSSDRTGNGDERILVWNRLTGHVTDASVTLNGNPSNDSEDAAISDDGRYVLSWSLSSNLVPGDTNAKGDMFVRDLQAGTTTRVSVRQDGSQIEHGVVVGGPLGFDLPLALAQDGRYAGFDSTATSIVASDTNRAEDAFVRGPLF
jgi:hypothetical protein